MTEALRKRGRGFSGQQEQFPDGENRQESAHRTVKTGREDTKCGGTEC